MFLKDRNINNLQRLQLFGFGYLIYTFNRLNVTLLFFIYYPCPLKSLPTKHTLHSINADRICVIKSGRERVC